jgi:sarcosine oxidase subunit beta
VDTCDVVVIGAGITGAAVAFELARTGRKVIVADSASTVGAGSTSDSSAILRTHYSNDWAVAAARDSFVDWLNWDAYLGEDQLIDRPRYVPTGALVLDPDETGLRALVARLDKAHVANEYLDADELEGRFPWLDASRFGPPAALDDDKFFRDPDGRLSGVYYAEAGYIDLPSMAALNLVSSAVRHGARFRRRSKVATIGHTSGRVNGVKLADGTAISAPVVVNAAGPWSDALNVGAGISEEMKVRGRPLRTQTHEIPCPPEFSAHGTFVTDLDLGGAFRPHGSDRIHISGTEPECDPLEWVADPDVYERRATDEDYRRQAWRTARRIPELRVPHRPSGIGALYDVTPDWTPIIDRTSVAGLYLACGTSGNSFKIAPFIGRAMSAIINATEAGVDHDASPVHLRASHVPHDFDLSRYSRLRAAPAKGHRNVLA